VAAGLLASGKLAGADGDAAVATLGPGGGEFTVLRNGVVAFTRSIGGPVTANEALLAAELKRNIAVYPGPAAIGTVFLAEPEERLGGWGAKLRRAGFTTPVKSYDPLAGSPADVAEDLRGRFAGAAGLLAAQAAGALPINFAAPRQPRAEGDPKRKLLIAAAVAALLVFGVGGAFGYVIVDSADQRLAALNQEKADLEKTLADMGPDRERLKAVDQWRGREVNYLDELYDLADRLPGDDKLRVNKVEAVASRVDKAGKQDGQALLKVAVGTKTPDAASALLTAFDRDNTAKQKYYVGAIKTTGGTATGNTTYTQLFTLVTKVNHRDPKDYTRSATFLPPARRGAPVVATPDEDE
jgi:hypothetical protein